MTSVSLRTEPMFVRWVTAEGVSMVGTAITTVVLPLIVYAGRDRRRRPASCSPSASCRTCCSG